MCFPEDIRDEFTALAVLFAPAVAFWEIFFCKMDKKTDRAQVAAIYRLSTERCHCKSFARKDHWKWGTTHGGLWRVNVNKHD